MPTFGFLNGVFLAGLAAAAIPILIHLFSRRKARNLPFSSLMFLQEISRKKIRRMRLRQWLLLALRVLAIAFFALAMGRPVVRGFGGATEKGISTVAIVLDDSYSMGAFLASEGAAPDLAGPRALTRFDLARRRVGEILDLLEDGDRVFLVFASTPVRVPYETPVQDFRLVRELVDRAEERMTRADVLGAMEKAQGLLSESKTLNKELFLVSDFQREDVEAAIRALSGPGGNLTGPSGMLQAQADGGALPAEPEPSEEGLLPLPEETHVYLIPVWGERRDNVALRRADYAPDPVDPSRGGRMTIQARNHSDGAVDQLIARVVSASAAPRLVGEVAMALEGQGIGQADVALINLGDASEIAGFVVEATADALAADNSFHVAMGEDRTYRILLVLAGSPADPEIDTEARYLRTALDPWAGGGPAGGQERLFTVEAASADDLASTGDIRADVVILLNVGRIPPQALESLAAYKARGGGVFLALGDRVDPRYYNTVLFENLKSGIRLGDLHGSDGEDSYFVLRPDRTGHPVFQGFPVGPGENLTQTRFRKALECRLGPTAQALASFSNGLPALVEDGGLLVFASSFDGAWSEFPTSGAFLPLVHKSLFYLIRREEGRGSGIHAGEPLRRAVDPTRLGNDRVVCTGPDGLAVAVQLRESGEGTTIVTDPLPVPGIYTVSKESGEVIARAAVNLDTDESDLYPMTDAQQRTLFGDRATRLDPDKAVDRELLEARFGKELWKQLLVLALLALFAESLLARGRVAP